MYSFRTKIYEDLIPRDKHCIVGADIGGTNSNFGVFSYEEEKPKLLVSLHMKSKDIKTFTPLFLEVISFIKKQYDLTVTHACIGAAGIVSEKHDFSKPTNLTITIDANEIQRQSGLETVVIINDFEAVGYGIALLNPESLIKIRQGKQRAYANKAVLGAGTGLGKCILKWEEHTTAYIPLPSEGGHADFAAHTERDFGLVRHMKKNERINGAVSWEDVLSGTGIQRIYRFLGTLNTYQATSYTKEIEENGTHPDMIFDLWQKDRQCRDTYMFYARLYGRCAKNFALDALALSGVYIAGGIAEKNIEMFKLSEFIDEFLNCGKQRKLLEDVPITILSDYNVSLIGAVRYLMLKILRV